MKSSLKKNNKKNVVCILATLQCFYVRPLMLYISVKIHLLLSSYLKVGQDIYIALELGYLSYPDKIMN